MVGGLVPYAASLVSVLCVKHLSYQLSNKAINFFQNVITEVEWIYDDVGQGARQSVQRNT